MRIYLKKISSSASDYCLIYAESNQRTKLCKNLSNIANETYVDKLSMNKSLVKSNMIYGNPAENAFRIPLLKDSQLIRSNQNVLDGFDYAERRNMKKLTLFLLFSSIY